MKNTFYFPPKNYFYFEIFEFSFYFGHVGKRFDKKAKLIISKFMASQTGKHIYNTHCPISQEVKAIRQLNSFR